MAIGQAIRMAGPKLLNFLKGDLTKQDLAARLMGDVFGGGLSAMYTPGDLGDKLIAGVTDATFSGALGLAGGRLSKNPLIGFGTDMAGSVVGMEVGRVAGDQVMRGKDLLMGGKGQTPFERLSEKQRQEMEQEIKQQVLAQYGLLPGVRPQYYGQDSYLQQLGLG